MQYSNDLQTITSAKIKRGGRKEKLENDFDNISHKASVSSSAQKHNLALFNHKYMEMAKLPLREMLERFH